MIMLHVAAVAVSVTISSGVCVTKPELMTEATCSLGAPAVSAASAQTAATKAAAKDTTFPVLLSQGTIAPSVWRLPSPMMLVPVIPAIAAANRATERAASIFAVRSRSSSFLLSLCHFSKPVIGFPLNHPLICLYLG